MRISDWSSDVCSSDLFVGEVRTIPVPARPRLRIPVTDFGRVLEAAERPDWRITIALGLFTFSRGSEIAGLRVGDVDRSATRRVGKECVSQCRSGRLSAI